MGRRIKTNFKDEFNLWSSMSDDYIVKFNTKEELLNHIALERVYDGKLKAIEVLIMEFNNMSVNDNNYYKDDNSVKFAEEYYNFMKETIESETYEEYYKKIDNKLNELLELNERNLKKMSNIERIKELTKELNQYRHEYYNLSKPSIEDVAYDGLFDELKNLEEQERFSLNNSPTNSVGYEVVSKLQKVKHNHPMLSLDKTKSIDDVLAFLNGREGIAMLKMDGLTCSNEYNNYILSSAESRGNGEIGEDIYHNVKTINNVPKKIAIDNLIVDGEVIIDYNTFNVINSKLPKDDQYKNPRNLASGSARQLDSKIASERGMRFIAWKVVSGIDNNSFFEKLETLHSLGFEVVPHHKLKKNITKEELENIIDQLKSYAELEKYPIDGIVFGYDDIAYGESLGKTGHHVRSQIAFKFFDEMEESVLREVEWNTTRTGQINPTAVFDTVILDNTEVSRASLFNLTFINDMKLNINSKIKVSKRNMIIPYIEENLDKESGVLEFPSHCPACGGKTEIKTNETKINGEIKITKILMCTNNNCPAKLLDRFVHFVKRDCMNIDGLSEATLEKFINMGLLQSFSNIYNLHMYKSTIINMEGMGQKSYKNLIEAIEKSKNVKLENFIYALGIPQLGKSMSKTIASYFEGDWNRFVKAIENEFDFTKLKDCGDVTSNNIEKWYYDTDERDMWITLINELNFIKEEEKEVNLNGAFVGKSIYCTGTFMSAKKEQLKQWVEENGGTFANGYAKSLDMLVVGSVKGSSKTEKALKDGVKVITEDEFIKMISR